jgi:hypothetical protein
MTGGHKTSFGGKILEQVIKSLQLLDYQIVKEDSGLYEKVLVENYPYKNIYGLNGRYEWMVRKGMTKFVLECKYQNTSGSVDEKLPYVFANLVQSSDDIDGLILVHAGNYWKNSTRGQAAVEWMKQQDDKTTKELHVVDLDGFMSLANRIFR